MIFSLRPRRGGNGGWGGWGWGGWGLGGGAFANQSAGQSCLNVQSTFLEKYQFLDQSHCRQLITLWPEVTYVAMTLHINWLIRSRYVQVTYQ